MSLDLGSLAWVGVSAAAVWDLSPKPRFLLQAMLRGGGHFQLGRRTRLRLGAGLGLAAGGISDEHPDDPDIEEDFGFLLAGLGEVVVHVVGPLHFITSIGVSYHFLARELDDIDGHLPRFFGSATLGLALSFGHLHEEASAQP